MSDLIVNEVGTTGTGGRLLVLIHGYGADEYDLAPITSHIDPDGEFHTICPRGPYDVFGAGAGWYERDADGQIDSATFLSSVDAVDATIDAWCTRGGFERSRCVIVGFSQGGAMALASALRVDGAARPAAMACLSGTMQAVDGLDYDLDADDLPSILVQHGTLDPVVPIERGQRTRDRLADHGVEHTYLEYPMQHSIIPESIADIRTWLQTILDED